jgi:hypothetical protein
MRKPYREKLRVQTLECAAMARSSNGPAVAEDLDLRRVAIAAVREFKAP